MSLRIIEYRVSNKTNAVSLGSAISRAFMTDAAARVDTSAIGPMSVNTAVKAICYARSFLQEKGKEVIVVPAMVEFMANGEQFVRIVFQIYLADERIHLHFVELDHTVGVNAITKG